MKVIKYILNEDGTIPDFIVDGGYFPVSNSGLSPQDLDFVGMTLDEGHNDDFIDAGSLTAYVDNHGFYFENLLTYEVIPNSDFVASLWQKWENYDQSNA